MVRVAPAEPTDTLLFAVAADPVPIATEFVPEALAPTPSAKEV